VLVFGLVFALSLALMGEIRIVRPSGQVAGVWIYSLLSLGVVLIGVVWIVLDTNLKVVHADMVYKQAQPYERQGLWDFSIILHQEAIRLAPQEDFYHLFLGRAFLEKAKSAETMERAPRTFSMSDIMRIAPEQLADLSRDDLLNASDTALKHARKINPLNTDHSANLGRLYRTRAESSRDPVERYEYFQESVAFYAEATSLSPNAAHLYDEWGVVYLAMGEREKAIERYEYSLAIDDQFDLTYMSLGDVYMRSNELDKAKEAYLKAVELNPRLPDVHSVLAYIYGTEKDYESAIAETERVLELTGNKQQQYTSYKNLAVYYQQLERMEEAVSAAQYALALAPESEQGSLRAWIAQMSEGGAAPGSEVLVQQFLTEGEVALNNKQWPAAEQAYLKALNLDPNLVVAHSALSYIYAQQGRLEEAEAENLFVLQAVPDDYATIKNLAIIYQQLKRYDQALSYARRALESEQATPEEKTQWQTFISDLEKQTGG
jgi:tetratricopeptide (TPR) repeat protein